MGTNAGPKTTEAALTPAEARANKVANILSKYKPQLTDILPKGLDVRKVYASAELAIRQNEKLGLCTVPSLIGGIVETFRLGLEINTVQGHAYLIPYEDRKKGIFEAQVQIGYKGFVALAYRSPRVSQVGAMPVFKGDVFDFEFGSESFLRHKPCGNDDPKELTHAWAWCQIGQGKEGFRFSVMTAEQINKIRNQTKTYARYGTGVWVDHYAAMARKTAFRNLFNFLPADVDASRAVFLDSVADTGDVNRQALSSILTDALGVELDDDGEPLGSQADRAAAAIKGRKKEVLDVPASTDGPANLDNLCDFAKSQMAEGRLKPDEIKELCSLDHAGQRRRLAEILGIE